MFNVFKTIYFNFYGGGVKIDLAVYNYNNMNLSNILNSSMGVGGMSSLKFEQHQFTNLKEKNGEVHVVHKEPPVSVADTMQRFGADFDVSHGSLSNCNTVGYKTQKPEIRKIQEINTHVNIFINEIQRPNYERFHSAVNNTANNIIDTAQLAMQMGGKPKTWNRVMSAGQGLSTFSTNLKSLQSSDVQMPSLEMCSNYWGMAIGAMSILSAILNDDDDGDNQDERFKHIFQSLGEIHKALKLGFERLESILINCVCERLTEIYNLLCRMETVMCDSFRDIHRKDLVGIADAIKKDLSGEFVQNERERRCLLLNLSTWIDCHCSASIETAKNRFNSPEIIGNAGPSFIINLCGSLLGWSQSMPNVDICLSACKLFQMAHTRWQIRYDTSLLYGRVIKIIGDVEAHIERFGDDDIEILIRQMKHLKFMIGRAIARVGFEIGRSPMGEQINKMTNKDEIMKLLDSIELRRVVCIKMCKLRGIEFVSNVISKEEYLRTIPAIDNTPNRTPYNSWGYPSRPVRSAPVGGHLAAHSGTPAELLNYLEYGLNVNAHCGWGNVLLNCLLSGAPHPQSLHSLLKCSELDTSSGQSCLTDPGSTWPIGTRPITYILNCAHLTSAVLFTANGYNIDSTNYGAHWHGGHWGDCGNLYNWAQDGNRNAITVLEIVKSMEDAGSFWHRDKLRSAYKYYKEYESGMYCSSKYVGDKRSLFVFSCILGLVPAGSSSGIDIDEKITKSGLTWRELSLYNGKSSIDQNKLKAKTVNSEYLSYLRTYKTNLEEMIKIPSESFDLYAKWIALLEPICNTINKPNILEAFRSLKKSGDIKQNLNLLNAMLKLEPGYTLGANIDILLSN